MEFLRHIDTQLFFFINHLPHAWWSDFLGEAFSGFGYAWIIWLVISVLLFIRKEKKDHWFWVSLGIAAFLCYILSEVLFKNIVMRPRPDMFTSTIVVGLTPGSFSFPSTHATIAFAFAYLFSRKEAHWLWLYGLAGLVCFSRMYLGHHYTIDVIGGMILGTVIGMVSLILDEILHKTKRFAVRHSSKKRKEDIIRA
jgi:undecaprenyl-diphosphatase